MRRKFNSISNDASSNESSFANEKKLSMYEMACFYVNTMNWSVFPLIHKDKKPAIPWAEYQKRLPTEEELNKWFNGNKLHNIGIATGSISGIDVVDLDSEKAIEFAENNFHLPIFRVKTARGWHLYFKHREGVKNFQKRENFPDIDLRGEGGYVVAPPSIHPSGSQYSWFIDDLMANTELHPLPDIFASKSSTKKLSIDEIEQGVPEGMRNATMARYVGLLIRKGFNRDQCLNRCMETNKRNTPPLEEKEVAKTVASIFARHEKEASENIQPEQSAGQGDEEHVSLVSLLTTDKFTYCHDQLKDAHVRFCTKDGHEVHPVNSKRFQSYIQNVGYATLARPIKKSEMTETLQVLSSKALFDGELYELSYRATCHNGAVWVDLGDNTWRAIRVTAEGWSIAESPDVPILFRRFPHMKPLPLPTIDGSLNDLQSIIHVTNEDVWILLKTWLCTALIPNIPRPCIVMHGLHGAGKSFTASILRDLIDPSHINLLPTPSNHNEFVQQINNNFLISLDNLQHLKPWMSDDLCRAITGGAFSKRKLYTDNEEIIYKYIRLAIINGISNPASASDLLDRSILIELDRIPVGERASEQKIKDKFASISGGVLGAMLDTLSFILRKKQSFNLPALPRMADWAQCGYAAAEHLGIGGDRFLAAYNRNILLQHHEVLYNEPVAASVVALAKEVGAITGAPSYIHNKCKSYLGDDETKSASWPKNAAHFSRRLKAASHNLRELGVSVEFSRGNERMITIKYLKK